MDTRPIGVFDSGVGGVSVLRNMTRILPKERFIYYGDDKNAPYGTRDESEILRLALDDVKFLMRFDVKAIVIACNTATSAAAEELRRTLPIPVIGMEPALKPASLMAGGGLVCVLATPATLKQKKFQALKEKYGADAVMLPCAGLMEFCERGETGGDRLDAFLARAFAPLAGEKIGAVVLGCTHYVFLWRAIQKAARGAKLFDGNEGTARQLKRVLEQYDLLNETGAGGLEMHTSGDSEQLLILMRRLYDMQIEQNE